MSDEKIYCGFAKTFGQYGDLKVSINVNDREGNRILAPNDKGWINLIVSKRKEPDKNGNEFSVRLDTFKPKPQTEQLPF